MRTFCADAKYFETTMLELRTFCADAKYFETTKFEVRTFCADAKYFETTRDSMRRWARVNQKKHHSDVLGNIYIYVYISEFRSCVKVEEAVLGFPSK